MLHTDLCHGVVGREHPRNGRRTPIADALVAEIQLGIKIAPHLRMDAVKREQTNVSSPLCIVSSALATAGTCSVRATASRHIEGERRGGATQRHPMSERACVHACPLVPRTSECACATVARRDGGSRGWRRRKSCPIDGRRAERRLRRWGGCAGRRSGATGGSALTVRTLRSRHSTMPAHSRPSCSKQLLHRATKLGHLAPQRHVIVAL